MGNQSVQLSFEMMRSLAHSCMYLNRSNIRSRNLSQWDWPTRKPTSAEWVPRVFSTALWCSCFAAFSWLDLFSTGIRFEEHLDGTSKMGMIWWTTVDGWNPAMIYRVLYIPGGAGVQPSTVVCSKQRRAKLIPNFQGLLVFAVELRGCFAYVT